MNAKVLNLLFFLMSAYGVSSFAQTGTLPTRLKGKTINNPNIKVELHLETDQPVKVSHGTQFYDEAGQIKVKKVSGLNEIYNFNNFTYDNGNGVWRIVGRHNGSIHKRVIIKGTLTEPNPRRYRLNGTIKMGLRRVPISMSN